jgi:hypothetical protein
MRAIQATSFVHMRAIQASGHHTHGYSSGARLPRNYRVRVHWLDVCGEVRAPKRCMNIFPITRKKNLNPQTKRKLYFRDRSRDVRDSL